MAMGQFIKGEWRSEEDLTDKSGSFERKPTTFRSRISPSSKFKPESGRYHLYVSAACPWAHRTLIVRKQLGLAQHIDISIVDPVFGDRGWYFSNAPGCIPDTVNHWSDLAEAYLNADPKFTGRVTVPVLWDKESNSIVNNESSEIIKIFAVDLADLTSPEAPEFYPEKARDGIDGMIQSNYEPVNNGVYRAGFASSQDAYSQAATNLFKRLDEIDRLLKESKYLCGDKPTLADICLYTTLVRFDLVYHYHFKCNLKKIKDYALIYPYLRHLHYDLNFAETCDFSHIKRHYYSSHKSVNPYAIIPLGPAEFI